MSPDEVIADNLQCVYGSVPTDVSTERKHTDLLDEYINIHLLDAGISESLGFGRISYPIQMELKITAASAPLCKLFLD